MPLSATHFDVPTLRSRRTHQWHKFADDVLPAWVADMDFGVAPAVTGASAQLLRNRSLHPSCPAGAQYASFARLNIATPAPISREIAGRMAEAVLGRARR